MHTYYDVKEMLHKELEEIVKKGELSAGSLETIDKLLNSIKNSCKIIMYNECEDDGYSNEGGYSMARGDNRGGNRRGGYSNARNTHRDRRGRYSREGGYSYANDEKIELLHEMMGEASNEEEKRVIRKLIREMEE